MTNKKSYAIWRKEGAGVSNASKAHTHTHTQSPHTTAARGCVEPKQQRHEAEASKARHEAVSHVSNSPHEPKGVSNEARAA